jgi:NAD(P)H-quinone oxidoreductase subunit 5
MVTYALIYKGVTALMVMPMVVVPLSLSVIEIAFGILAGFFIMKWYLPQLSMALC